MKFLTFFFVLKSSISLRLFLNFCRHGIANSLRFHQSVVCFGKKQRVFPFGKETICKCSLWDICLSLFLVISFSERDYADIFLKNRKWKEKNYKRIRKKQEIKKKEEKQKSQYIKANELNWDRKRNNEKRQKEIKVIK